MSVAVALLQLIDVGGCRCPSSCNVSLMILSSFAFKNSAPSSASAAYAATNLSIRHSVDIAPFMWMGCLYRGFHTRKKCPAARLRASLADKYDTSERMFRIM